MVDELGDDSSGDSLQEQFEKAHLHLDYVDRTLDGLAEEIESIIEEELQGAGVQVEYYLDTGGFEARLPLEEVTARLNRRLEMPFYVKLEGDTIIISDIREEFDVDLDEFDIGTERVRLKNIKGIIEKFEATYEDGAPVQIVLAAATQIGMAKGDAQHEIEKLRRQGDVYEPEQDHLRTL